LTALTHYDYIGLSIVDRDSTGLTHSQSSAWTVKVIYLFAHVIISTRTHTGLIFLIYIIDVWQISSQSAFKFG